MENENPMLFDELANRKKWTYVSKNSSKAIKDYNLNRNYWNLLNHMPKSQVNNIVTKRVLEMDQMSCDNLLNAILEEKREDDFKKRTQK